MNVLIVRMNIVPNVYSNIKGHVHITKGKYTTLKFNNIKGIFKLHCNQVEKYNFLGAYKAPKQRNVFNITLLIH